MRTSGAVRSLSSAVVLAVAALSSTTTYAGNYYGGYDNGRVITGAIVGTVVGTLLTRALQPSPTYVYTQPVYAQPYSPHIVPVAPYPYYKQPRACETVRIPVYDTGGRLIQYVQQCVN